MCISIAGEHGEYDHVEQTDDLGWGHMSPRYVEHIFYGRPASSCLVGVVFGGWRRAQGLAIVLLVQATTTAADIGSVVSLHKQIGSFASSAGRDFRRRNSHALCQRQAERLVLNTARQTGRVRLENVRRWGAVHWDKDATVIVN